MSPINGKPKSGLCSFEHNKQLFYLFELAGVNYVILGFYLIFLTTRLFFYFRILRLVGTIGM